MADADVYGFYGNDYESEDGIFEFINQIIIVVASQNKNIVVKDKFKRVLQFKVTKQNREFDAEVQTLIIEHCILIPLDEIVDELIFESVQTFVRHNLRSHRVEIVEYEQD